MHAHARYVPAFAPPGASRGRPGRWRAPELRRGRRGRYRSARRRGRPGRWRAPSFGAAGAVDTGQRVGVAGPGDGGHRSFGVAGAVESGQSGSADSARSLEIPSIEYGQASPATIAWDDAAAARMKRIPAFVRGMVVRAVEESCRKNGFERVTVESSIGSARGCRRPRCSGSCQLSVISRQQSAVGGAAAS